MPIIGITHSSRKVVPGTPTIGTATDVGTNRGYNDGAISVTFTPADGYATSFTAYAYDSIAAVMRSATGASSPIVITGFRSTSSTSAVVQASNANGTSASSGASNTVTVTTVPFAPATIGTLSVNGSQSLSLNTWGSVTNSAPTSGGKTISSYRARLFPGSLSSATGDLASPGTTVWNSLTLGNSYYAQGYAVNANGESGPTPASNTQTVGTFPQVSTNPTMSASGTVVTITSGTWLYSPTSYTYQIATSAANLSNGIYVHSVTTTSGSSSYTGAFSTTYYGKVIASNAYGNGVYSPPMTATTGANLVPSPTANPILTASATQDRLTLTSGSWTNSPTTFVYSLYLQSTGALVGYTAPITATSFVFQDTMGYNIDYATTYTGSVAAYNAYGNAVTTSNAATTPAEPIIATPVIQIIATPVIQIQIATPVIQIQIATPIIDTPSFVTDPVIQIIATPDFGGFGCWAAGTMVRLSTGEDVPIETIQVGDQLLSANIPGYASSDNLDEVLAWSSSNIAGVTEEPSTVVRNELRTEPYYYLINNSYRVSWEHMHLINRDGVYSWKLTSHLEVGDSFTGDLPVEITSIELVDSPIEVYILDVEDLDTFYAEGIITHNPTGGPLTK